jgi:hypothetical protein
MGADQVSKTLFFNIHQHTGRWTNSKIQYGISNSETIEAFGIVEFLDFVNRSIPRGIRYIPILNIGRAVLRRLVVGFPPRYTASSPVQVMWDLWWTSGTEGGFLQVLLFPMPTLILSTAPHSSSSLIRQISGRHTKWTESHPVPRDLTYIEYYWHGILFG